MQVLTGHVSQETALGMIDYPYGSMRCRIKFWLEHREGKGYRFVSQTQNPKNGVWNKPKASTYAYLAGAMYLDDKGHCHWSALSEYSRADEVLSFIKQFGNVDPRLMTWCVGKMTLCKATVEGRAIFKINNMPLAPSPSAIEDAAKEMAIWKECLDLLKG